MSTSSAQPAATSTANAPLAAQLSAAHVLLALAVMFVWGILGGRAYCSWVCPYHLVAEWAEMLHLRLAERGVRLLAPLVSLLSETGEETRLFDVETALRDFCAALCETLDA